MAEEERSEYTHRLTSLVVDLGTDILRLLFKRDIPPGQNVGAYLTSHANIITSLQSRQKFNRTHLALLGETPPNESKFDISLLYILITNVSNIPQPLGGWSQLSPLPTDKSAGAMLMRLREVRNKIAYSYSTKITKSKFEKVWTEVEEILLGLASEISQTAEDSAKKIIEETKTKPIGEELYHRLILEEWSVRDNLEDISRRIGYQATDTSSTLEDDLKTLKTQQEEITNKLVEFRRKVGYQATATNSTLEDDLQNLKTQQQGITNKLKETVSTTDEMKRELTELRHQQQKFIKKLEEVDTKTAVAIKDDLMELRHQQQKIINKLEEVDTKKERVHAMIAKIDENKEYERTKQDAYLPEEIMRMDSESQKMYLKALQTGEIKVHNIRVMVVGHFGVGKSTLTKRLLGEDVDINARNSTEGIDVHVKRCRVDLGTGMWKVNSKDTARDDPSARIAHVLRQEVSKNGNAENPKEKASNHQHEPSDGKTSLETSSNNDSIGISDAPSGLNSTDLKQNKESSIQTTEEGVMNTRSSPQIEKEMKLLEQGSNDKEMRDIAQYADLSIWDFAGQSDFYGTHQMFLSPHSVYILVIDLSQEINSLVLDDTCCLDAQGERKMKISEFVEFWLQSIFFYTQGEDNVILVGTHAGELPEERRGERIKDIFKNLRSHLGEKPFCTCLYGKSFAIDNRIVDPKLKDLKSAIFKVAKSKKDYWGESIPARWLTLERKLNEMRQKGEKIIESHVFEETNKALSSSLPQEELNLFLRFHHACGLLLFFSDDNLRDIIILDPQWLIDAFKCFITADMFMENNDMELEHLWTTFKNSCVLTEKFIDESWGHSSNDKRFWKHKVHLLRIMEKLDIIARPVTYPDDDGHQNKSKILDGNYFTPCMLKEKPPSTHLETSKSKSTSRLCYTYSCTSQDPDSGFVPPAVFHRLLAACMSRWQPRKDNNKTLLFSGCGVFDLDSSRTEALYLYLRDNFIQMWITHFGKRDYPNVDTCIKTKGIVESLLKQVWSTKEIITCIKCPKTDFSSSEGMIEISHFRDNPEYCCPMHDKPELKDHVIQSDQVLRRWGVIETAGSPGEPSGVTQGKTSPDLIYSRQPQGLVKGPGSDHVTLHEREPPESGLSHLKQEQIHHVYRDVDDGRIHQINVKWLEEEIEKKATLLESKNQGMTEIYLLNDKVPEWGFRVVVKKVTCARDDIPLMNESLAGRLRHHAIVPLLAKCQNKDVYYFVFPYMEKGDLMKAIADDTRKISKGQTADMKPVMRVRALYQIACAMLYIHTPVKDLRHRMFHGDITSRNLVLDEDGNIRLLDFGGAQELKPGQESVLLQTGDVYGTPGYTTTNSLKKLSTKTDCRNFGVLILEMLTGQPPKKGDTELQRLKMATLEDRYWTVYEKMLEAIGKDKYEKLKALAKKCLDMQIAAKEITTELYSMLNELSITDVGPACKKGVRCAMCMLNKAGDRFRAILSLLCSCTGRGPEELVEWCDVCMLTAAKATKANTVSISKGQKSLCDDDTTDNLFLEECLLGKPHVPPAVCVACMRNSYINPIQCLRCRETIHTKIGNTWAAILIEGFEKDDTLAAGIRNDLEVMRQLLISKYPLVTGIDEKNVLYTTMSELIISAEPGNQSNKSPGATSKQSEFANQLGKLVEDSRITTIWIYYSGHLSTDSGFCIGKNEPFSVEDFENKFLNNVTKDKLIFMDCCSSACFKSPNIKLQLNASRINEVTKFSEKGSHFTRLVTQSLRGKSSGQCWLSNGKNNPCRLCEKYKPDLVNTGFISGFLLYNNIYDHIKEYINKNVTDQSLPGFQCNLSRPSDMLIGYYTDKELKFDFFEDKDNTCCEVAEIISEKQLKTELLKQAINLNYDVNGETESYGEHLKKYWDIVRITIQKGPRDVDELCSIPEITRAWNIKLELSFGMRKLENIHMGRVGVFFKYPASQILDRYWKHSALQGTEMEVTPQYLQMQHVYM